MTRRPNKRVTACLGSLAYLGCLLTQANILRTVHPDGQPYLLVVTMFTTLIYFGFLVVLFGRRPPAR